MSAVSPPSSATPLCAQASAMPATISTRRFLRQIRRRQVVEEEQRLGADRQHVVHTVVDEVLSDPPRSARAHRRSAASCRPRRRSTRGRDRGNAPRRGETAPRTARRRRAPRAGWPARRRRGSARPSRPRRPGPHRHRRSAGVDQPARSSHGRHLAAGRSPHAGESRIVPARHAKRDASRPARPAAGLRSGAPQGVWVGSPRDSAARRPAWRNRGQPSRYVTARSGTAWRSRAPSPSSASLSSCSGTSLGYCPLKHAVHSRSSLCPVASTVPASER